MQKKKKNIYKKRGNNQQAGNGAGNAARPSAGQKEKNYTRIPFEECLEQWMEHQKTQVKPSTYSTYLRIIRCQILPELRGIYLDDIDGSYIQSFLSKKSETGRSDGKGGLSNKTISDVAVLLNSIFRFAEEKYKSPNPMDTWKRPSLQKGTIDPLNEDECRRITCYLMSHITPEAIGILSSLYAGLRLGEVCALRWENIDLRQEIFKVRFTLSRVLTESLSEENETKTQLVMTEPKTNSSIRDIPIPQFLIPLLKRHMARNNPENYLLTSSARFIDPRTYQNHFKKHLKECGLRSVHYHCLRHTFATNCVSLNFDIKTLSEILGHASTTITLERYVHSSLYQKQKQMLKISDSVASIL